MIIFGDWPLIVEYNKVVHQRDAKEDLNDVAQMMKKLLAPFCLNVYADKDIEKWEYFLLTSLN